MTSVLPISPSCAKGQATLAHLVDVPSQLLIKRFFPERPCHAPGQPSELTHSALLSSAGSSGCWGLRGTGQGQAGGRPIPDSVGRSDAPPTTTTMTTQSMSHILNKTHRARPIMHTQHPLSSPSPPALNLSQHQILFK